ncbi:MAG TPA: hypothetical protein VNA68_02835 [Candidatus Dormibacteraeota bacterium]|nr:hypothetical protein [Candidatus Dormibacteraeota bacterium]
MLYRSGNTRQLPSVDWRVVRAQLPMVAIVAAFAVYTFSPFVAAVLAIGAMAMVPKLLSSNGSSLMK